MNYTQKLTFSMLVPTAMVAGAGSAVALGAWWIQREAQTRGSEVIAGYLVLGGWGAGVLTVLCVATCLAFTVWIRRTALLVLGGDPALASAVLAGMADGNLAVQIPAAPPGSLLDSLQRVVRQLESTLGAIGQTSRQVSEVSLQIGRDNQDLSQRTLQTVSQLGVTAEQVRTLNQSVQHSTEAATQAHSLASRAAAVTHEGGEVVGQVVSTMDEIHRSSQKIADIIGVIDGIAFQTNILALNAAIEAARAGEQGRGFAVVASEVRSLAGRSAQAAREIKQLIELSVSNVTAGTDQVRQALKTMEDIVSSVNEVSATVADISASAQAQRTGMLAVNDAIQQLDAMNRNNEQTVQSTQAASSALAQQAQALMRGMGVFRL